jgi:hypothetical protein
MPTLDCCDAHGRLEAFWIGELLPGPADFATSQPIARIQWQGRGCRSAILLQIAPNHES